LRFDDGDVSDENIVDGWEHLKPSGRQQTTTVRARVGAKHVTSQWVDCERAFIAQRYDRIAGLIGLFDRLLFLPSHLRRRATTGLRLKPGDRVLEIG
jgi:hypothetical protein